MNKLPYENYIHRVPLFKQTKKASATEWKGRLSRTISEKRDGG